MKLKSDHVTMLEEIASYGFSRCLFGCTEIRSSTFKELEGAGMVEITDMHPIWCYVSLTSKGRDALEEARNDK